MRDGSGFAWFFKFAGALLYFELVGVMIYLILREPFELQWWLGLVVCLIGGICFYRWRIHRVKRDESVDQTVADFRKVPGPPAHENSKIVVGWCYGDIGPDVNGALIEAGVQVDVWNMTVDPMTLVKFMVPSHQFAKAVNVLRKLQETGLRVGIGSP